MFNLLVRVRCTSFPEIRVMCLLTFRNTFTRTVKINLLLKWLLGSNLSRCLLTLAFLFCVKYLSRLCSFESKKFWNLHFFSEHIIVKWLAWGSVLTWTGGAVQILLTCFASSLFFHTPVSSILGLVVLSGVFQLGEGWWLHPSDCSFGENTDAGHHFSSPHLKINERMQIPQKGICIVGRKFLFE